MKRLWALILALVMALGLWGCADFYDGYPALDSYESVWTVPEEYPTDDAYTDWDEAYWDTDPWETATQTTAAAIDEDGWYYSVQDVALYIHTYGCLPDNYITKSQARALGWEGGSVEYYAPGCAIGGDLFYNYEGQLPEGRQYYECDIDTDGYRKRGAKRLVYSDDGLIFYTTDHYETFTLLYGEVWG